MLLRRLFNGNNFFNGRSVVSLLRQSSSAAAESKEMSAAMKFYLLKKRNHDAFIDIERQNFERGKQKLSEMMGIPIEALNQEEIDRCIEYLFPSGLHDPMARPVMKPPEEVFPKQKDAEFDFDGRPFHPFFYCVAPNFVQTLYDLVDKLQMITFLEDRLSSQGKAPSNQPLDSSFVSGSRWVSRSELEDQYLEKISDQQYEELIETLERLVAHPLSYRIKDFLMGFRKVISQAVQRDEEFIQPEFDERGAAFVTAIGQRKSSVAHVKVTKPGTGKFSVTHIEYPEDVKGIGYFNYSERHEIMYPLQLTRLLGVVDIDCFVYAGGPSGQSGAIRYALSVCLKSFVDSDIVEEMRLMGLLTQDIRVPERKRFGHVKSRKKPKYKKR